MKTIELINEGSQYNKSESLYNWDRDCKIEISLPTITIDLSKL